MKIKTVTIGKKKYSIFTDVTLFPGTNRETTVNVAEERLEKRIQTAIKNDDYLSVEHIDKLYRYYVPQDIANTKDEKEIRESIEDVYEI